MGLVPLKRWRKGRWERDEIRQDRFAAMDERVAGLDAHHLRHYSLMGLLIDEAGPLQRSAEHDLGVFDTPLAMM